jgi:SSS family solute:Na+ symporter
MHKSESAVLGIAKALFGREVLIAKMPWPVLDPMVIALPVSIIVIVAVTLLSKKQASTI